MPIHTSGDSHASHFDGWKECSNVRTRHLGPTLCHSFGEEELNK